MDPDATLQDIRQTTTRIENDPGNNDTADMWRLVDLVSELDSWLSGGGFLPTDWHRAKAV